MRASRCWKSHWPLPVLFFQNHQLPMIFFESGMILKSVEIAFGKSLIRKKAQRVFLIRPVNSCLLILEFYNTTSYLIYFQSEKTSIYFIFRITYFRITRLLNRNRFQIL